MAKIYWLYDEDGNFDDADLWSSGTVPGPSDNATIATRGRTSNTIFVTQNESVNSLTLVNDHNRNHVFFTAFTIKSATFSAKNISNDAYIYLNGGSALIATGTIVNSFQIDTDTNTGGTELIEAKNLVNNGAIGAENLDVLTIDAPVTGNGVIGLRADTIICKNTVGQDIEFGDGDGYPAELELADSVRYSKTIIGFATDGQTSLDLDDVGFVGSGEATFSGTKAHGVLTVTDGTHTAELHLQGDYLGVTFSASSDGHGGTIVVANAQAPAASTHAFISAMASLGAPPAHPAHAAEAWNDRPPLLAGPRTASA